MLKFVLINERESSFQIYLLVNTYKRYKKKKNSRADLIRRRPDVVCYT